LTKRTLVITVLLTLAVLPAIGCGSPPKPTWRLEARTMQYKADQGIGGEVEFTTEIIKGAERLTDRATCELVRFNTRLEADAPYLLVATQKHRIELQAEQGQRSIRNAGSRDELAAGYEQGPGDDPRQGGHGSRNHPPR
jgi:hypothetical protein